MLSQPRFDEIMRRLTLQQRVSVLELAEALHVSDETIRRDLKGLEELGKLRRIHGGAILPNTSTEQPLGVRSRIRPQEKARIAQKALGLIRDGMSIFLDTGTTTQALAARLDRFGSLNLFTNSLDIAQLLNQTSDNRVTLVPGSVRRNDSALIGSHTLAFVEQFHFDIAFMGIGGIDLEVGFMDYEEPEALLRRLLCSHAKQRVILADSGKVGLRTFIRTIPFDQVDCLVTSKPLPDAFAVCLEQANVTVLTP
ncbi:DeoR/GlpR family DNA-binding transcription regulator [Stutzerimonas kirkiae]|uniref:DeoR/GlpR transcriptional regulator n=1 Tax=Stutzerimonas kirkiae TaxID=2211392 RepID=A0A4Q9RCH1_9GAMM|nr:DeoR/GlpR family DNA-binding transcription regulator [Stutzerimonas kirkiae]TBU98879.1 DeoR/GlpR transcriptional regulator [Stutzerimonas kirkiae]TBV03973.1 DeoR/GlpR transcriptional regulator [Stutzerimonas kirkiae]TBV09616.1 DeoR/GlpR transcriptional regulator [Stutzerimonas kirkiae]TBV16851.1 DeoR/GlpR transcriptional regulator [Stutzerimonas kirkiae]